MLTLDHPNTLAQLTTLTRAATKSIAIAAYLIHHPTDDKPDTYHALWAALAAAPSARINCRLLSNATFPTWQQTRYNIAAAAVLTKAGWRVRWTPAARTAHAKYVIIDATTLILGSSNLVHDPGATTDNLNVITTDHQAVLAALRDFDARWTTSK